LQPLPKPDSSDDFAPAGCCLPKVAIAYKSNERGASRPFDTDTYKKRNTIERLIGHLKECRRVATRYEKLAVRYHAFLKIACILYLLYKS